MIRSTRVPAVLAALGLAASLSIAASDGDCYVALAGNPETTADDVMACEQQTWFHRSTSHGQNLGYLADAHGTATFDTNPPAGSVSGGNGGGYIATQGLGQDGDLLEAQFNGTFNGVLDRLDVDLHNLFAAEDEIEGEVTVQIILSLGGAEIFNADEVVIKSQPEPKSAAGSTRMDFAITGLAKLLDGYGFANTDTSVHDVTLTVKENWTDYAAVWAFDTTEVPGGITFNPVVVPANTKTVLKAS